MKMAIGTYVGNSQNTAEKETNVTSQIKKDFDLPVLFLGRV